MANVLISGPIHEAGVALLNARTEVDFEMLEDVTVADLDSRIADLDAVLLRMTPLTADTIGRATKLKVVSRYGVGYDNVDVDALTRHGIPLAVIGEANSVTVAEHTLGMMIATTRRMVVMDRATRDGRYDDRNAIGSSELWGKTVLIVGFGRIGRRVARRCAAFDMTIVIADPYAERQAVEAAGYRYVADFRDVLEDADFVTLHLPANPDGEPIMGAAEFAKMKAGGYFINAARGSLVDETALVAALRNGRLRGAGLDVTRDEPPAPDCPLLELDTVVLSPHAASLTEECIQRMTEVSVQNILDAIDGRLSPDLVVNKEVLG